MNQRQLKQSIKNFNTGVTDVPFERQIVSAVDKIIELVKQRGYPPTVQSDKDWEIVEFIWHIFSTLYPNHYNDFVKKQKEMKGNQKNKFASNREKGGAQVRHLVEIPEPFYKLIHAAYPQQKVQDKKFALEMGKRLPLFRWAEKQ
jgi:hypothetical protein